MNKKTMYLIAALSVTIIMIIVLIFASMLGNDKVDDNKPIEKNDNNPEKEDKKIDKPKEKDDVISYKNVIETKELDYQTLVQKDPNTKAGNQEVLRDGKNGKETTIKLITLKNGKETNTEIVKRFISQEPVNKIVLEGTKTGPTLTEKTVTENTEIEYKTITKKDNNMEKGKTLVHTKGKNGVLAITYKIKYSDGVETSKKIINKKVIEEAVNEIVFVGTREKVEVNENIGNSNKVFDTEKEAIDWANSEITKESSGWYNCTYSIKKLDENGTTKYSIQFEK